MMPTLTVVIATSARPQLLKRTLESLAACPRPASYGETIVVENGGGREGEAVAAGFRSLLNVRYQHLTPANKSAALNAAIDRLPGGLVVFFDDDVRLEPDVLRAYAAAGAAFGAGHFFGGPTKVDYDIDPPTWLRPYLPASASGWSLEGGRQFVDAARFLGFNWAAFVEDLRRAGPFNPDFGPGSRTGSVGQETEMLVRLLEQGGRGVYLPDAVVWHYVPPERCSIPWLYRRAHRLGVRDGLIDAKQAAPGRLFARSCWKVGVQASRLARELVRGTRESRFRARYDLSLARGYARGVRVGRHPH